MLLFIVILLTCRLDLIHSFNVDVNHSIVLELDQQSKAALFGHSLIIDNDVAYIGAPDYETRGGVFKCTFDGKNFDSQTPSCKKIPGLYPVHLYNLAELFGRPSPSPRTSLKSESENFGL
jgi:hypothetical protein